MYGELPKNIDCQYGIIVVGVIGVKHFSELSPKVLVEPFVGLAVSLRYINAADNIGGRRARAATVALFLSLSAGVASTSTPSANAALGTTVVVQIESMRAALAARGGSFSLRFVSQASLKDYKMVYVSLQTSVTKLHPYREKFALKSKITIDKMFHNHTARRYIQGSSQKFKIVGSTCLTPIASTQINTTVLVSWSLVGVGLIGFTTLTLVALHLFQRAERKPFKNKNDKVFTSVTTFLIGKQ